MCIKRILYMRGNFMKPLKLDNYYWQNDQVILRALKDEDWEFHYYNRFDTPGRRLVNYEVELPPTENEAREFSDNFKDFPDTSERLMFGIEDMKGNIVGAINLNSIDERNGTFSIGLLIDRDHRGMGYGTAAMKILLDYAFYERRLNKYYGTVLDDNIVSPKMLKKLGCVEEGVRSQMVYTEGKYHDVLLFGMTREEYERHDHMK